jgi:flagella basal body P-ring formation protein FlgA
MHRRLRHLLSTAVLSIMPLAGSAMADADAMLEQAAEHAASAARQAYPGAQVTVRMVPLDPRLQLAPCTALELRIPGERVAGRIAVHARCQEPQPWGLYLTAQVDVVLPVVALARPVPRDTLLRASDLVLTEHNLSDLRDGYLTDLDTAVGMEARSNLRADAVLYQRQLAAARLVSKGDSVVLEAGHGHVAVSTQAIALTDGVYGEQIEVRNPRSNRIVTGWVTGRGTVTTRP